MTTISFSPPAKGEYPEYFESYISKVPTGDFIDVLAGQPQMMRDLLGDLPEGEDNKPHPPYTWTLKQVVGHLLDVERIFSTRMLRIGVGDTTPMPGMDQNEYVDGLDYENVSMTALLDEFAALRESNRSLAMRLGSESLARTGTASDCKVSARANLFILVGHVEYHVEIMRLRVKGLEG